MNKTRMSYQKSKINFLQLIKDFNVLLNKSTVKSHILNHFVNISKERLKSGNVNFRVFMKELKNG